MLNRAHRRATIFREEADYEAFECVLTEALERMDLKLFSYCLMPSHWDLRVSPQVDGEMSRFGQWLGLTHTQRYNAHYQTAGEGHLYQGRYKSFPVQSDEHLLSVCRYVERNAYTADVTFSEDQSRLRKGHADTNFSILRRTALSLLKNESSAKVGIKNKRLNAGWDDTYLAKVLFGK